MKELKDLVIFVSLYETGSFTLAAQRLYMTKAAISKRIAALEDHLGLQLVKRTTRSISFTPEGESFYVAAKRIDHEYNETIAAIKSESSDADGLLRVGGPLSFGRLSLEPVLISFINKYQKIHVQLILSDKFSNVVSEGLDLVIRLGQMKDSSLCGRSLGKEKRIICAAPSYIKSAGEPQTPAELLQHRVLHYSGLQSGYRWPFEVNGKVELYDINGSFTADNGEILAEAAAAGDGIVMLPEFILQPYLQNGQLVPIMKNHPPLGLELHLLWPKQVAINRRLRLLIDHLIDYYNKGESKVAFR
ncbi:LysR family transcriptional regulator [Chromatiaceae bacterium AAb-1]|nr:LysR family transcriptional regulator [Chromatiaceae bacterium AAb-1]